MLTDRLEGAVHLCGYPLLVPLLTVNAVARLASGEIHTHHIELDGLQNELRLHLQTARHVGDAFEAKFNHLITVVSYANTSLAISERRLRGLLLQLEAIRPTPTTLGSTSSMQ